MRLQRGVTASTLGDDCRKAASRRSGEGSADANCETVTHGDRQTESNPQDFASDPSCSGPMSHHACDWCVSCGGDAVKWWSFADHRARGALRVDAACAVTAFARASDILAVGLDGGAVLVLDARPPDAGGGRVLRRLGTHAGRAARDLSWSATRQSLYAVCGRGALHRWDVASGACVDRVAFAAENRNRGAMQCGAADVITFMDADDLMAPNRIERVLQVAPGP